MKSAEFLDDDACLFDGWAWVSHGIVWKYLKKRLANLPGAANSLVGSDTTFDKGIMFTNRLRASTFWLEETPSKKPHNKQHRKQGVLSGRHEVCETSGWIILFGF